MPDPTARSRLVWLRAENGMSQTALAEAMRLHGFQWTHQTVAKVERRDKARGLRLAEGLALAEIFGVDPAYLIPAEA